MKVLMVSDYYEGGGAESVFRSTMKIVDDSKDYCVRSYFSKGKPKNPFSYIFSIHHFVMLIKVIFEFKPQLIHVHNYYHSLSPSILLSMLIFKKMYACKVVFTAHDYHILCPNSGFLYFRNGKLKVFDIEGYSWRKFVCKRVDERGWTYSLLKKVQWLFSYKVLRLERVIDSFIFPSKFIRDVFIKLKVSDGNNSHVIRNPYLGNKVKLERRGVGETIKLAYWGRLSKEKGIIQFLNRLSQIETGEKIKLIILGVGEEESKIKKLKFPDNLEIELNGYVESEKIPNYLHGVHAYVLPSVWYENAPLSIIEAAFLGLPVIVNKLGGMKEMAGLTKSYKIIDISSLDEIIDAIHEVKYMKENSLSLSSQNLFLPEYYLNSINKVYGS